MTPEEMCRRHHLLGTLEPAALRELLAKARTRRFAAGETVFRKGDAGDGLYGVLDGGIVVTVESEAGKELILNRFGPGDLFGEIALLDGQGRTATAVAREPSVLLFIARQVFLPFIEARPKVAVRMIALLCERLRRTTQLVEDSTFLNVPGRLAKQLAALAAGHATEGAFDLPISQDELARTLGVSREIVSRQLSIWKKAGLVELRRGHIVVRDIALFDRGFNGD